MGENGVSQVFRHTPLTSAANHLTKFLKGISHQGVGGIEGQRSYERALGVCRISQGGEYEAEMCKCAGVVRIETDCELEFLLRFLQAKNAKCSECAPKRDPAPPCRGAL